MDWYDGLTIGKNPESALDWAFNWSDWLNGDTITSYLVTVQTGLTLDSDSNTTSAVTVWLSGGTADATYSVACQITTASGRTAVRDITIDCGEPPGQVVCTSCS